MKTHILILSVAAVFISSCAMQKRHYMKGYYLDLKDGKHTAGTEHQQRRKTVAEVKSVPVETIKIDVTGLNQHQEHQLMASIKPVTEPKTHRRLIIPSPLKSIVKKPVIKPERKDTSGLSTARTLLIIFGIIFTFAGAALAWFVSAYFALMFALGLAMWIVGGSIGAKLRKARKQNNPNNTYSEYQDVVYLKNGSIIRGMIIEQIPGISLKLETRDGNVFVYKMEEIEKMTKEKMNK